MGFHTHVNEPALFSEDDLGVYRNMYDPVSEWITGVLGGKNNLDDYFMIRSKDPAAYMDAGSIADRYGIKRPDITASGQELEDWLNSEGKDIYHAYLMNLAKNSPDTDIAYRLSPDNEANILNYLKEVQWDR